jgi:CRP-like cAMP-binding protein
MYIVQTGALKVALFGESGRELTLAELKPGDFFGEMALLDNSPRSATVVAVSEATVLMLTRDAFSDHLRAHPQTALNILAEMTRRLRRADETIANLALHDVEARLRRTLERLAREDGESVDAGLFLRRRPTQQALANMVGSCRETVSRTFTSMIKRGLLIPRGRGVVLVKETPAQPQPQPVVAR